MADVVGYIAYASYDEVRGLFGPPENDHAVYEMSITRIDLTDLAESLRKLRLLVTSLGRALFQDRKTGWKITIRAEASHG
jgi:hypothetical protein